MSRLVSWVDKLLMYFLILVLVAMVIVVFMQVLFRYVLQLPLDWTEGLSRLLFIWMVFIGLAAAFGKNNLISIELFSQKVPERYKLAYNFFCDAMNAIYIFVVGYAGIMLLPIVINNMHPSLRMSWAVVFSAIPVGIFFMLIYFVNFLVQDIRALRGGVR